MKTRYFAFGCSYVKSRWGTIADLIGANFDEFYNYGASGGCNYRSHINLLQVDKFYKLNKDTDFVTIGVTGFARFSFIDEENKTWISAGDILPPDPKISLDEWGPTHNPRVKAFAKNVESYTFAVYRSWVAILSMVNFLESKQIKYKIYPSIDNSLFLSDYKLSPNTRNKVQEISDLMPVKQSIDEFIAINNWDRGVKYLDGNQDTHPQQKTYYNYLKTYFPEFDNEKTKSRFDFLESIFTFDSMNTQTVDFSNKFVRHYRKEQRIW